MQELDYSRTHSSRRTQVPQHPQEGKTTEVAASPAVKLEHYWAIIFIFHTWKLRLREAKFRFIATQHP